MTSIYKLINTSDSLNPSRKTEVEHEVVKYGHHIIVNQKLKSLTLLPTMVKKQKSMYKYFNA